MKAKVTVHMVNGASVSGRVNDLTDEEVTMFKNMVSDLAGSKPTDGWQINLESENGSWGVFPKQSILWVELESVE